MLQLKGMNAKKTMNKKLNVGNNSLNSQFISLKKNDWFIFF